VTVIHGFFNGLYFIGDNQLQIVGKLINKHSKLFGVPIENFYYISVCMKLGSCYVDTKGERCNDPFWTITDVNDKNKAFNYNTRSNKFKLFKNGIHFNFTKGNGSGGGVLDAASQITPGGSVSGQVDVPKIFLDSVVYKVQILP
jgi:hypothetical protein